MPINLSCIVHSRSNVMFHKLCNAILELCLMIHYITGFFRVSKQRLRESRTQAIDFLISLLAGLCLGVLAKVSEETFGAQGYMYTVIAVCKCNIFYFYNHTILRLELSCGNFTL